MDLPRDPFEHMRKIMEQYSAAERAIQQAQTMDPLFQLRKNMGAAAFDAIFNRRRSAVDEAFEQSRKQIAEAQRITDQLRLNEEAERIERATTLRADEWRWIEAVRKAAEPFNPVADLYSGPQV